MHYLKFILVLISISISTSCGFSGFKKKKKSEPIANSRLEELKTIYGHNLAQALLLTDKASGWITPTDCDGMIWSAKAGVNFCEVFKPEASEFEDSPGRFGRRPPPRCYDETTNKDNGSKTTWSRDMAVAGLFPYIFLCNSVGILSSHILFGETNNWVMGQPVTETRVIYTPNVLGLLYQMNFAMTGNNHPSRLWPAFYPNGLVDFEAHLQVMSIWLRGEIATKLNNPDDVPKPQAAGLELLQISGLMFDRLIEHRDREPLNPFYQFTVALYSDGDYSKTIDLLLDPTMPMSGYVRCEELERCKLGEWLFVTKLVLSELDRLGVKDGTE